MYCKPYIPEWIEFLADYLKSISVKVTGSATGYTSVISSSAPVVVGALTLKPVPAISGSATVGSVLTAVPGVWDSGVALSYQWFSNGVAIAHATSASYTFVPADFQKSITVKVTGSAAGYASETTKSDPLTISAGALSSSRPTITGLTTLGSVLTVVPGAGTGGTSLTYQWFSDGTELPGATGSKLTLTSGNIGHEISVTAAGSLYGYATSRISSLAIIPSTVPFTPCSANVDSSDWLSNDSAQPSVSGELHVGVNLKATTGTWATGTSFCTYWYENGQAIKGAYGKSYLVQPSDLGQNLQFVVIGTDKSGNSRLRYSQFQRITKADFKNTPTWSIIGQAKVGFKLAATITQSWNAGVTYTFQWLRNGVEILGARTIGYTATQDDLGYQLSVRVCGSKNFYNDLCTTSSSSDVVVEGRAPKK